MVDTVIDQHDTGMASVLPGDEEARRQALGRKAVIAAAMGNILEWYDFAIYGFMASIIAQHFFPAENAASSLLATFAVFGVGFLMRPLGGVLIGRLADVKGRKVALLVTLFSMACSTVVIGLVPSFETIGIAAPIIIVLARLVQGFSGGGEWGGSTAFMVEWAPRGKRGFYGSFQQSSLAIGMLLGSAVAALTGTLLGAEALNDWGWRIPFLLGGVLGPVGLYLRRNIDESPAYEAVQAEANDTSQQQAENVTNSSLKRAVRAFGFTIMWTVSYYTMLTYMPTFIQHYAGMEASAALWSNTIGLIVLVLVVPLMGALSDRVGRRPLLLLCCASFVILPYPLFKWLLSEQTFLIVMLVQIIFALMISLVSGPGPAAIAEMFPTRTRSTWMSVGYSLAVTIFGGFAPFIATLLIEQTGTPISPTYYLIAGALASAFFIWTMRETAHVDLR